MGRHAQKKLMSQGDEALILEDMELVEQSTYLKKSCT
jgi:hypothetical protein